MTIELGIYINKSKKYSPVCNLFCTACMHNGLFQIEIIHAGHTELCIAIW